MRKRKIKSRKIGVLMGGRSSEREISLRSGKAIYKALKSLNYNVVAIDVGDDICKVLKKERIDIAFIALHGGYGENGAIQGMLELMGIRYTGSGVLASALSMNKEASKKVFLYHGIPVPPFKIVSSYELSASGNSPRIVDPHRAGRVTGKSKKSRLNPSLISRYTSLIDFGMPWVVKPVSEGSSIGVEIVRYKSKVGRALNNAFCYGNSAIVEKYIKGKEIHIGILNNRVLGGVEVRPSLEFYNYRAKYTAGLTEYILPPQIGEKAYKKSKKVALSAHKALGCMGATRVDLRVDNAGNPFVLEVNTIPGMTETSLLPKIAKQSGLEFPELLEDILEGIDEG